MKSHNKQLAHEEWLCHKWELNLGGKNNNLSSQLLELNLIEF